MKRKNTYSQNKSSQNKNVQNKSSQNTYNPNRNGRIRNRRSKNVGRSRLFLASAAVITATAAAAIIYLTGFSDKDVTPISPAELLSEYMHYIPEQKYKQMYSMLHVEASGGISQKDFIERNAAIYEGIEIKNMSVEVTSYNEKELKVSYKTSFDTAAGEVSFKNEAFFMDTEDGSYGLVWDDSLIFPQLGASDKVKVSTIQAKRGEILDRNGRVLAGAGTASSVGIVPGRMKDPKAVEEIAGLLGIKAKAIRKKLSAGWVKEDSFVPITTIPKVKEIDLMSLEPDERVLLEQSRQEKLLAIPGVMLSDVEVREYPLHEAAAHLTGYVQNVTAEDLEKHAGEGYTENSVIGRLGAEGLFEKKLKGVDGCRIYITDAEGGKKDILADIPVQHGENVRLTIDADLQISLYEQFQEDKSCSVAINPFTGEVLALVSTPSYDCNDFIMGLSNEQWKALNEDEDMPMYNRFRQTWCPGSTFKPVIAAVGLESGAVDPNEDYGNDGRSWQKGASWGSYYVTTLHVREPVNLENALIASDNIYFAKAALKIGAEEMESSLTRIGFNEELPFEITMAKSQYSNEEKIETEIQLADSGYGQGQVLANPLHMASIYSAFCNGGSMIRPYLVYADGASAGYWIEGAFSKKTADIVLEGTKKVVNDPEGTGYAAHRDDIVLAGKTGTAEIKASKEDKQGTELGWFAVYTPGQSTERPILLISMAEDVKERGGSGHVVRKDHQVLEEWFREQAED